MTRSASNVPEVLTAVGEGCLIINRDVIGTLIVADTIPELASPAGIPIAPGQCLAYDLSSDRAIVAQTTSPGQTVSVAYDLLKGGFGLAELTGPPGVFLGSFDVSRFLVNQTGTFPMPPGYQYVGVFVIEGFNPANPVNQVLISDTVTGLSEMNLTSPMNGFYASVLPIGGDTDGAGFPPGARDTFVNVRVSNNQGGASGMGPVFVWVFAYNQPPTFPLANAGSIPQHVTDDYGSHGGYIGAPVIAGAGLTVTALAAPAAGTVNRIKSVVIQAATTAAGTAFATLVGHTTGASILGVYSGAAGSAANGQFDLPVTEALDFDNGFAVTAECHIFYRNEPIV